MWLIDVVQVRWLDWKVQAVYVRVSFEIDNDKISTKNTTYELDFIQNPRFPPTGKQETNTLIQKENTLIQKKINIQNSNEIVNLSKYWLDIKYIEKEFEHKKTLATILNMCRYIEDISYRLNIVPVYNKDTINATNILRNNFHLNDLDSFIEKLELNWSTEIEDYAEFIRADYYLPEEIEKR